jgi:hypothetical protein
LNLCAEFLVFALGGLLWLRRFDERNFGFPIHLIEYSEFFPSFPICCHFDFSFHAGAPGGGCFLSHAGGSTDLPAVRTVANFLVNTYLLQNVRVPILKINGSETGLFCNPKTGQKTRPAERSK